MSCVDVWISSALCLCVCVCVFEHVRAYMGLFIWMHVEVYLCMYIGKAMHLSISDIVYNSNFK